MDNFNRYQELPNKYLGSDRKKTLLIDGEKYLLKFPDPIRNKRHVLSYINNAVSEYLGCHVFESIGLSVQETRLGFYKEKNGKTKIACACKDFCRNEYELYEVKALSLANTENETEEKGDILDTLSVIRGLPIGKQLEKHFWDMFVVDALICNTDRHEGNWGVLMRIGSNDMSIAPVYDCGSSLVPLLADEELSFEVAKNYAINARSASILEGRRTCFSQYILSMKNPALNEAVKRMFPRIDMKAIEKIIEEIDCISEKRKCFYKDLIRITLEQTLKPVFGAVSSGNNI